MLKASDFRRMARESLKGSWLLAVGAGLMEKINKNLDYGEFRVITLVYALFVAATMFCSMNGFFLFGHSKKFLILMIGSILFVASDLVLSSIYFEKGKNTKVNVIINHTLYYAAQFLFASTLLFD